MGGNRVWRQTFLKQICTWWNGFIEVQQRVKRKLTFYSRTYIFYDLSQKKSVKWKFMTFVSKSVGDSCWHKIRNDIPVFLEKYFMILLFSRALVETTEFPSLKFALLLHCHKSLLSMGRPTRSRSLNSVDKALSIQFQALIS